MFVRWKKRKRKRKRSERDVNYSIYAYLVESYRDDSSQPRQRHLAYLGGVRGDRELTYWIVEKFWKSAYMRLEELDLTIDQRNNIENQLEEVVPRPSEELMKYTIDLIDDAFIT